LCPVFRNNRTMSVLM